MRKYKRTGEIALAGGQVKSNMGGGTRFHSKTVHVASLELVRRFRGILLACSGLVPSKIRSRPERSFIELRFWELDKGTRWNCPAFARNAQKLPAHTTTRNALAQKTWRAQVTVRLASIQLTVANSTRRKYLHDQKSLNHWPKAVQWARRGGDFLSGYRCGVRLTGMGDALSMPK